MKNYAQDEAKNIIKDYKKIVKRAEKYVRRINKKNLGYSAIVHFDLPQSTKKKIKFGQAKVIQQMLLHNQICRFIVQQYKGKVIKELGDAILATFNNAGTACECALNVIYNLRKYGNGVCTKVAISDGIIEKITINGKGDIYGTAVDLCDRVAKFASPDSVLVHHTVFLDVKTVLKGYTQIKLGKVTTKNLKDFGKTKLYAISLKK